MTTPSLRAVRWDHLVEEDPLYSPSSNHWGFAAWLATKTPGQMSEEERVQQLTAFVHHVVAVYKPNWPTNKHRTTKIPAVSQDPKIQEEFTRWARSLNFSDNFYLYAKSFDTFTFPVSWTWFAEAAKTSPSLVFGFQLAVAMRLDQFKHALEKNPGQDETQKQIQTLTKYLTMLGIAPRQDNQCSTVEQLLQLHDEKNPENSLANKEKVLRSLFSYVAAEFASDSLRALTEINTAVFPQLVRAFNPEKMPTLALDLPADFDLATL